MKKRNVCLMAALILLPAVSCDKETSNIDSSIQAVDMGTSVLWADRNLGAEAEYVDGDYYTWGTTSLYYICRWSNYPLCDAQEDDHLKTIVRYNTDTEYGTPDGKTRLSAEDDAASARTNGKWRIPTKEEFLELLDENKFKWEWMEKYSTHETIRAQYYEKRDGYVFCSAWDQYVTGYKVTNKESGESIFFPATGQESSYGGILYPSKRMSYWSATLGSTSDKAVALTYSFDDNGKLELGEIERCLGVTIRPVMERAE